MNIYQLIIHGKYAKIEYFDKTMLNFNIQNQHW